MPKRHRSSDHVHRHTGRNSQRGLYLVLDDGCQGYSIHKVDLLQSVPADVSAGEVATTIDRTEQPLPPALIRLEAPSPHSPMYFAAAFDTKIMAMRSIPEWLPASLLSEIDTKRDSAYDVRACGMVVVPQSKVDPYYPIYISTRDNFYALSDRSFERLALKSRMKPWKKLQDTPFESKYVTCYAVHPDQQTMFVSVLGFDRISTFSFRATRSLNWEKRGDWALPFTDQGHFDHELNAWVGLSRIPDPMGHICTCNVASATTSDAKGNTGEFLDRRLSNEDLLTNEPGEGTIGYNLVYMGGKSCFCLVEAICISSIVDENAYDCSEDEEDCSEDEGSSYTYTDDDDDEEDEEGPMYTSRYLLRLTTFSLKFDENGDPTTGNSRRVQYYSVPEDATKRVLERPFAFWM